MFCGREIKAGEGGSHGPGARATRATGPYPPHTYSPNPPTREHRRLACVTQA